MFNEIKSSVSVVDAYNKYCTVPLKETGANLIPEDDVCPWHGGKGAFRITMNENGGFAKCFNPACQGDRTLDAIEFTRVTLGLDRPVDAARRLIQDFGLDIAVEVPVVQRIFNAAAAYYRRRYESAEKNAFLDNMTPNTYQIEVRGHRQETLDAINIGWADGMLHAFLAAEGYSEEDMYNSGIVNRTAGGPRDIIPADSFVYPHCSHPDRVSRFTFKCRRQDKNGKYLAWQMKKDKWLNNIQFYGQDSLVTAEDPDNIAVVEGENDMLSLIDMGWAGPILATNGQPSRSQWDMLEMLGSTRRIHTFFDADEAGDNYRSILWSRNLPDMFQYKVPDDMNDVDNYIQRHKGAEVNPLEQLMEEGEVKPPAGGALVKAKVTGSGEIVERGGCYYGVRETIGGDGEIRVQETMLSNFTIRVHNIYQYRGDRIREVSVHRQDGAIAESVFLGSQARISLRHFKEFCSRTLDALWFGSETDLNNLWLYIMSTQPERQVVVTEYCGYIKEHNAWIFRNIMIDCNTVDGKIKTYEPDERGIFWLTPSRGIMPKSILSDLESNGIQEEERYFIPELKTDITDYDEFMSWQGEVVHNLAEIVGPQNACTMMGWIKMNAYSNFIFKEMGFFPMFMMWGRHGKGKTTILKWLLAMFDMEESNKGYLQVSALKRSTVGFLRNAEYYSSLPIGMDEIRADQETQEHYDMWRGFFQRSPRILGTAKRGVVLHQPIRSTLIFAGQDAFVDSALQSRVPALQTSNMKAGTHADRAYHWLNGETSFLSRLGYWWILESVTRDKKQLVADWNNTLEEIQSKNPDMPTRTMMIWKMVAQFSRELFETYFPGEDYLGWLAQQIKDETTLQTELDVAQEIWECIAAKQIGLRRIFSQDQVRGDKNRLYIWWPGVKNDVEDALRSRGHAASSLSRYLQEEPYFINSTVVEMGKQKRRVLAFDLESAPEIVQQIASVSGRDL